MGNRPSSLVLPGVLAVYDPGSCPRAGDVPEILFSKPKRQQDHAVRCKRSRQFIATSAEVTPKGSEK